KYLEWMLLEKEGKVAKKTKTYLEKSPKAKEIAPGAKYLKFEAKKLSGNFAWGKIMAPGARFRVLCLF
ncbi:hypothetical protein A2U01_0086813, partial [Trifolium medium]|nr:hypothetical protein [Trifolium medium]